MALALRIFKAENVGFVQLQRLFPEIMMQLLKKNQIHNSYFEQFCVGTIFSLYRAIYTWKGVWLCILRIMLAFCTMCVLLSTSSHHIHLRGGLKPSETERSPRSSARKRVELSYRLMWRSSRIYRFSS